MIARIQKIWILSTLLGTAGWLLWAWPLSPVAALGGAVLTWLMLPMMLGLQFFLMQRANRNDPVPRPSALQLWRAGAAEWGAMLSVFGWRQPFRSRTVPDRLPTSPSGQRSAERGVVLVHGLLCNRGVWLPWMAPLHARGHAFIAVNLEPVLGPIDDYVPLIEDAVQRITQATGQAPVLICHSMGGMAARAWLRAHQADKRVHRVITLGTPHGGTALARYSQAANGQQMRPDSEWLRELQRSEPPSRAALFTCWYSNCDNMVFPASTGLLPGAEPRFLPGVAHVQMASHAPLIKTCLEILQRD